MLRSSGGRFDAIDRVVDAAVLETPLLPGVALDVELLVTRVPSGWDV